MVQVLPVVLTCMAQVLAVVLSFMAYVLIAKSNYHTVMTTIDLQLLFNRNKVVAWLIGGATIYRNLQKQKAKQKRSLPGKKRGFLQKRFSLCSIVKLAQLSMLSFSVTYKYSCLDYPIPPSFQHILFRIILAYILYLRPKIGTSNIWHLS
jgi:hypothetical protein